MKLLKYIEIIPLLLMVFYFFVDKHPITKCKNHLMMSFISIITLGFLFFMLVHFKNKYIAICISITIWCLLLFLKTKYFK